MRQQKYFQAKELIEAVEKSKSNVKDATSDDDDENSGVVTNDGDQETLSNDAKIHRILLLRSWLLHFVGSMHSYFMSRVLHSTEIELKSNLSKCSDLVKSDIIEQKLFQDCVGCAQ